MKRFKTIQDWLATNPSKEEQDKVLILIHRGETSRLRKELYEKEGYLRKLQALANHFKKLELEFPDSENKLIEKTKAEIVELRKSLPDTSKFSPKKKKEELAANPEQE
jgi:molecular chaperone GrpE (heat shock protein)